MTPQTLVAHNDSGQLWPQAPSRNPSFNLTDAYQLALATRRLRLSRAEHARGDKMGFTNRNIWQRYNVYAPIWGTVYDTTVSYCDGLGSVSLASACLPRIEPEAVFGMKSTPAINASLDDLFEAIEWVAPGFEVVQSHLADWKFKAPDAVADGGLHSCLLIGRKVPLREIASSAEQLNALLAAATVTLQKDDQFMDEGCGINVLDSPLLALHHFLAELRQCPGAPDLLPGDVVTTGTWTDAWPVEVGERWTGAFSSPLSSLTVDFR